MPQWMTTWSPIFRLGDRAADLPHDARGVAAADVERRVVGPVLVARARLDHVDRRAEAGPDVVVVDAGRHHPDQHLVGLQLGRRRRSPRAGTPASARRSDPGGSPARACAAAPRRAAGCLRAGRGPSCVWSPGAASGQDRSGLITARKSFRFRKRSIGLVRFSSPMVDVRAVGVVVAGEEHGVVGQARRARRAGCGTCPRGSSPAGRRARTSR